jgi:hypothetical protein
MVWRFFAMKIVETMEGVTPKHARTVFLPDLYSKIMSYQNKSNDKQLAIYTHHGFWVAMDKQVQFLNKMCNGPARAS